jgi:transcriptional regulator with XRE-family HTH domain
MKVTPHDLVAFFEPGKLTGVYQGAALRILQARVEAELENEALEGAVSAALRARQFAQGGGEKPPERKTVRALRKEKGYSQAELGEICHMKQAVIYRVEKGRDLEVRTLEDCLLALDYRLRPAASFPGRPSVPIAGLTQTGEERVPASAPDPQMSILHPGQGLAPEAGQLLSRLDRVRAHEVSLWMRDLTNVLLSCQSRREELERLREETRLLRTRNAPAAPAAALTLLELRESVHPGLTRDQAAERMGIDPKRLYRMEHLSNTMISTLASHVRALGATLVFEAEECEGGGVVEIAGFEHAFFAVNNRGRKPGAPALRLKAAS